jgi:uncharacterized membrane-anchored protein YjiN (DUF445 family)
VTTPAAAPTVPALLGGDPVELRRMKRRATGLLGVAAGVFLGSTALPDTTAVGFVQAAAEAGMVGGVADWFAVTALFRHPLGLRIPHTALVPRKKDELATKLGEFVTGNFLTPDSVSAQLADAHVVRRVAEALAEPRRAERVGAELAAAAVAALDTVDEAALTEWVLELMRRDLSRRSYAPVLGQLLGRAVEGQGQRPLLDVAVPRLRTYLVEHREELKRQVDALLERQGLLVRLFTTDRRIETLLDSLVALLEEVEHDPDHELRRWVDGLLAQLADDLRTRPDVGAKVDAVLRSLVDDPHVQSLLQVLLVDVTASVRTSLTEVDGGLQQRLAALVVQGARRVLTDADLERRIEDRLQTAVRYGVEHYGDTVVSLISRTVAGWEARDASSRIEAAVGRDLQFIRINGTVVGALAGVAIHTVAVLVG